jgi:protein-disulfide isomerase
LNTFNIMVNGPRKGYAKKVIPAILLFLFFCIIPGTASTQELFLLSFGKGQIQVKLYADYFCGPCGKLEPKIEYLISDLVKRGVITITFIDAPFHKHSSLYTRYFLYILNEKKDIGRALKARTVLFEGAKENIFEGEKLEAFLQKQGIKFKSFDVKPVFTMLQNYLREDSITSTPTCVIVDNKKKEVFAGADNIVKALENIK